MTVTTLTPNRKEIGKAFKKDAKVLIMQRAWYKGHFRALPEQHSACA